MNIHEFRIRSLHKRRVLITREKESRPLHADRPCGFDRFEYCAGCDWESCQDDQFEPHIEAMLALQGRG